jgi:acetolactate synthase-1/3 small subunit
MPNNYADENGMERYTLSIRVEDKPGVLSRVVGLFSRRAFNIHSLAVGPSEEAGFSVITVIVDAHSAPLEQIVEQIKKLVPVTSIDVLDPKNSVQREIILVKVATSLKGNTRTAVKEVTDLFRSRIVDVASKSVTIEATGDAGKIRALISALEPFGIISVVKSGAIALSRGCITDAESGTVSGTVSGTILGATGASSDASSAANSTANSGLSSGANFVAAENK